MQRFRKKKKRSVVEKKTNLRKDKNHHCQGLFFPDNFLNTQVIGKQKENIT
jgi:hypothetical protein